MRQFLIVMGVFQVKVRQFLFVQERQKRLHSNVIGLYPAGINSFPGDCFNPTEIFLRRIRKIFFTFVRQKFRNKQRRICGRFSWRRERVTLHRIRVSTVERNTVSMFVIGNLISSQTHRLYLFHKKFSQ